ncbi:MAG TPA: alpha/beta hydrolase-fold protein [Rhodanobacteraceae bacterium]|nr:alpha/beta hydrolase-fold protein [Rhodanobacteraceae bacterium]
MAASRFEVSLAPAIAKTPVTGHLLVVVSTKGDPEPRQQISFQGPGLFGKDVDAIGPDAHVVVDAGTLGYPANLDKLPAGDYYAQAVLVTYTRVKRADGHAIWVPVEDRGVVSFDKPGNLVSGVAKLHLDPASPDAVKLVLDHAIPPLPEEKDTRWLRHVRIHSKILSKFWGTDVSVVAHVLLPKGFDAHPDARYPLIIPWEQGDRPFSFDSDPATNTEEAKRRAALSNLKTGYEFYQEWNSDHFPRVVAVTFEDPSPYFLDSYVVDSANNGPWGRAFTEEIIPYLEKKFRLIGKPYARIVEGASTGGWEALAMQLYYPDYFGGAWVFNPDPISFRHYQLVDIYKDDNMFSLPLGELASVERPFKRSHEGQPLLYVRQLARLEAVLGTHGRSGFQLDIWQATHGPVGPDGYPALLFDKLSGKIDHRVADYYRKHGYDLTAYLSDNWQTLAPKLRGKLNMFSGEMDDFYLNLGVYDFQNMLEEHDRDYPVRFEYGRPEKGHSWHLKGWAGTVREMAEHIRATAPRDADVAQWNY